MVGHARVCDVGHRLLSHVYPPNVKTYYQHKKTKKLIDQRKTKHKSKVLVESHKCTIGWEPKRPYHSLQRKKDATYSKREDLRRVQDFTKKNKSGFLDTQS